MIKKIPLPATGVMLGMAALGNLLQSYSEGVRLLCFWQDMPSPSWEAAP